MLLLSCVILEARFVVQNLILNVSVVGIRFTRLSRRVMLVRLLRCWIGVVVARDVV